MFCTRRYATPHTYTDIGYWLISIVLTWKKMECNQSISKRRWIIKSDLNLHSTIVKSNSRISKQSLSAAPLVGRAVIVQSFITLRCRFVTFTFTSRMCRETFWLPVKFGVDDSHADPVVCYCWSLSTHHHHNRQLFFSWAAYLPVEEAAAAAAAEIACRLLNVLTLV